ncbi:MAG: hypothetical protein HKN70_13265, partial [Gammaproteobacteria bacterium]|nr:hypothetical protein [Gammaproteobacteria bacterium]
SLRMGRILIEQLQQNFAGKVQIMTPQGDTQRGAQLSLRITHGGPHIQQALIDAGVICDWREPDGIRIAFAPLYNRYTEILRFLNILERILDHHG